MAGTVIGRRLDTAQCVCRVAQSPSHTAVPGCRHVAVPPHKVSSSSAYSYFYVGSIFDDIHLHVARSYTSLADSPSFISSLTLSNHLLSVIQLFLPSYTVISIVLLPALCSSLHITCPAPLSSLTVLSLRFLRLSLSPYSFISYPVKLCNSSHPS